jgi:hypothetical protein
MARTRKHPSEGTGPDASKEALVPYSPPDLRPWTENGAMSPGEIAREQELQQGQERELHMAWVQLRGNWNWLAMVPADPADSTTTIARALCQVGARLSLHAVEFIEAARVDLDGSSNLITRLGTSAGSGWAPSNGHGPDAPNWAPPLIKTIVAVESPLANPLALPLVLAADGVVLCIRRGHDRIGMVRQAIESIGADRIVCCLLVD